MPVRARLPSLLCMLLVLGSACVTPEGGGQRQAEAGDDGVQATGRLDGSRVAISDGDPEVVVGDCDPGDGTDQDVCWVARTIDGLTVAFVVENPAVLVAGESVAVRASSCTSCDDVDDRAVVDVRVDGASRRAGGGRLDVQAAGGRYAAGFQVTFAGGDRLSGSFNVRPRAPGEP